jgi:hypothetical protein
MAENPDGTLDEKVILRRAGEEDRVYDLVNEFERISARLESEFLPRARQLVSATRDLVVALEAPFLSRYSAKRSA